jgi:hypothetical protein
MEIWDALSLIAERPVEPEPELEQVDYIAGEPIAVDPLMAAAASNPMIARLLKGPSGPEVPFEERKNVKLLRESYYGALDESLEAPQYRENMEQLVQLATIAVEIFKNPRIKKDSTQLPEDQLAVVNRLKGTVTKLKSGVDQMWRYLNHHDKDKLAVGFHEAEQAMHEVYVIQKIAAQKAEEIERLAA